MSSIEIYIENNCFQCWLCKNRVGSDHHGRPECKVADKYMYEVYEEPCPYFESIERAKKLIISTADVVEVVHGEWLIKNDGYHAYGETCSACGEWLAYKFNYKYCPNCGARMDERRENEHTD